MSWRGVIRSLAILAFVGLAVGCARPKNPLRAIAKELDKYPEYSVILADMSRSGTFFKRYEHQYQFLVGERQSGSEELQFRALTHGWRQVSKDFYRDHEPYLGMVILSKGGDQENAEARFPPGYQYVGNRRYGTWRTDARGDSFWEFYGKYALFSTLLGGGLNRPVYRTDWDAYRTTRRGGQPFFGRSNEYGTRGTTTRQTRPSFYQRQQARQTQRSQRFSDKVRSRTGGSRSRGSSRSRGK